MVCKAVMQEKMKADGHMKFLNLVGLQIAQCKDATALIQQLTAHPHDDETQNEQDLYSNFEFIDDVTGRRLDQKLATKARNISSDR